MKSILLILITVYLSTLNAQSLKGNRYPFYSDSVLKATVLFAPGLVLGSAPTFTPDGKTVYTHQWDGKHHTIMVSYYRNNQWTKSKTAEFSGIYDELEPCISHDGKKLYFFSDRFANGQPGRSELVYMERTKNGWSDPRTLGFPITIPGSGSGSSSLSKNGNLYFGSTRKQNQWPWEIYFSKLLNGKYSEPVNINDTINPGYLSWSHCIAPDESFIIFASEKPGGFGGIDLYVSIKENNKWTQAKNFGNKINTEKNEVWPRLSPDGKYLFFRREENDGSIYQIDVKPLLDSIFHNPNSEQSKTKISKSDSSVVMNSSNIELNSAEIFYKSVNDIHAIIFSPKEIMYLGGKLDVFMILPDKSIKHFIKLKDYTPNTIIWSMTLDKYNNLYIAANDRIVKVTPDGLQQTLIQENFTGPCGATDLRFDKKENHYVVFDNKVVKYDKSLTKTLFIDGSKFSIPIQWAVGIEISDDEKFMYIGDCNGSRTYVIPLSSTSRYSDTRIFSNNFSQYFTKDCYGQIYNSSPDGRSNMPEFLMFKDDNTPVGIYCNKKPSQDENNYKKTIAFGQKGFNEKAIYCIIGNNVYLYEVY
jgi:Tol biopolymer transport system component